MKKVLFTATVDSHILQFHLPFLKLFKEKGYEVHVATNGDTDIPYCDVKHIVSFERNPFKINNLKAIKQLKKILKEEHFDIIHTHTPMGATITRLAAKKARRSGTRVIYTAHGFHFYKGASIKNWLIYYPVEKFLSKSTDTLITINKEDYELAKNKFNKRCKNIEYVPGVGIDEDKFNFEMTENEKTELRKSLGLKKCDFVMIFPAELNKNKNQIFLINVMEKLVKKDKNIHLLLPGVDTYNGYYQKITKQKGLDNNIHFLGYRNDIPRLLKISNLAVSSSLREGLPLNVMEAMYTGLPVIALDCRGVRDLIENGINGYIVKQSDCIKFCDYILSIKNNNLNTNSLNSYYMLSSIIVKMEGIYNINQELKKVLFVTPSLGIGGIEICLINMLKKFPTDKYEVTILSLNNDNVIEGELPNKVNVMYLEQDEASYFFTLRKSALFLVKKLKFFSLFKRILKPIFAKILINYNGSEILWLFFKKKISYFPFEVDCVIAYGDGLPTYYSIDRVISQKKIAWVHTDHNKALFLNRFNKNYYYKYGRINFVSNGIMNVFLNYNSDLKNKCMVLYNLVDYDKILKNSLEIQTDIVDSDCINLISIGRITSEKGYIDAVKIASRLKKDNILFKWYVVGNGKDYNKISKMIEKYDLTDHFILLGEKKNPYPYLLKSDIFVQTSKYEGFSTVVTEAKILCKPMIITNVSGSSEQIDAFQNGVICDMGELFYIKLKELIMNNSLRKKYSLALKKQKYVNNTIDILLEEIDCDR